VTKVEEPVLDGMPEVPPSWVRPESGVRMSALALEHMLAAALPHCGTDDELPILQTISVAVLDGRIVTRATDRYTLIRERRPVSQTCDAFTFLLRTEDAGSLRVLLKTVLRGLKDDDREHEPVDLAIEHTDTGPTLRVLGQDLDVRFTEQEGVFPNSDGILDSAIEACDSGTVDKFDTCINPTLLARVVAAQKAGRGTAVFRYQQPKKPRTLLVTTLTEDDDLTIALVPLRTPDGAAT
jgi:hypothetical protein